MFLKKTGIRCFWYCTRRPYP